MYIVFRKSKHIKHYIMTTTTRYYNCSDSVFTSFASQSCTLIREEHDKFKGFSTYFTDQTLQGLDRSFAIAEEIPSDKVFVDMQAKSTNNLTLKLEDSGKFYQKCKFNIEMAFPNDKNLWNQFGFNDYEEARKSPRNMYMFYCDFQFMANLHKKDLLTKNWTEETFTQIEEIKNSLKELMNEQTKCMVERGRATENRIIALNSLYELLAKYMKAAKLIYEGNDEMLKWFKFPSTTTTKKEDQIDSDTDSEES